MEGFLIFLYIVVYIFSLFCAIKIAQKAGYSPWFGVLMSVPIVNFIVIGIFAFETWPILKTGEQIKTEKIAKLQRQLNEIKREDEVVKVVSQPQREDEHTMDSCPNCNKKVTEKMTYCPQCGRKLKL